MTLFTNSPEDWQRLDWQILRDGGIALYWRDEYLADDLQWLARRFEQSHAEVLVGFDLASNMRLIHVLTLPQGS